MPAFRQQRSVSNEPPAANRHLTSTQRSAAQQAATAQRASNAASERHWRRAGPWRASTRHTPPWCAGAPRRARPESAARSPKAHSRASGVSGDRRIAPKTCIARLSTRVCSRELTSLIAETSVRAAGLVQRPGGAPQRPTSITTAKRHSGCAAPVMNHLRPLSPHSSPGGFVAGGRWRRPRPPRIAPDQVRWLRRLRRLRRRLARPLGTDGCAFVRTRQAGEVAAQWHARRRRQTRRVGPPGRRCQA